MSVPRLILASSSPQRQRLLAESGYEFEVVPPHESAESGVCSQCGPAELVTDLALRKALAVAEEHSGDQAKTFDQPIVILACDTVAECGGEILGKPRNEDHARAMLERLRGTVHRCYSGVCVLQLSGNDASSQSDQLATNAHPADIQLAVSELRMDEISDDELDDYLASGLWRGKAGAFGLQDRPGWLRLQSGSESNVIGLPMEIVPAMLAAAGVAPN